MSVATSLSVVQTILAALSCSELKELCSNSFSCTEFCCSNMSDLGELNDVVVKIKNVLLDAEAKYIYEQPPPETQQYIEELSFSLYDADDLLDEFVTLAKQKHLLQKGNFIEKVRLFFSRYNQLTLAYRTSQGIKKITTKLDGVASRHRTFGLSPDHSIPIRKRRYETCSYADTIIIGRDEDVVKIVGTLLDSNVSALTIVGMGGMGKTALVQLVFNHEKIIAEFSLRLWVCVSDHDQKTLDVQAILAQILESGSGQKSNECSMGEVVKRVRELLLGKRFLIVLDDLWTESRNELQKLLGHLVGDELGSQIVVTTRSEKTANIIGESVKYELKGLSEVDSWKLFRLTAFDMKDHESPKGSYMDKLIIGKDIIKKCVNVPLAIKVIGGLLYREDMSKWREVQKCELANLSEDENRITPILKLSYHNLESPLKSCFSYCSLFPKDYEIDKKLLIRLWIAQGNVVPRGNAQTVEDVGEEYFSVLLRRCFFQDVEKDRRGQIATFKIHDLMHDVALEVSNKEICPTNYFSRDMDKAVRHVSLTYDQYANFDLINAHVRTIQRIASCSPIHDDMVLPLENYQRLRSLDLSNLDIEILPASIGKLIHLRNLNLAINELEVLPNSITELYNLQTLDLGGCERLKELPKNFSNLVNLRDLRLARCYELTLMPFIITWMSKLIYLDGMYFKVGVIDSSLKQQFEGLKALKMLRGELSMNLPSSDILATQDNTITDGGYLRDMEHLDSIDLIFNHHESNEGGGDYQEELLGALQPHKNLKDLGLQGYLGERMPRSWAIEVKLTSALPNLVKLALFDCCELKCLPTSLENLQNLKELWLLELPKLEYMETPLEIVLKHGEASGECLQFFPCLQILILDKLPKFKGWGRSGEIEGISVTPLSSPLVFSNLIVLSISNCLNLASLPGCPNIKNLELLYGLNEGLQIFSNPINCLKLNELSTNMSQFDSLVPLESLQYLTELTIYEDGDDLENLDAYGRVFRACPSLLKTFRLSYCWKLTNVSGGQVYLTALQSLIYRELPCSLAIIPRDDYGTTSYWPPMTRNL